MRKIIILDTTLRDGDQSPGFSLSTDEKIVMADYLEKIGVDIIEAGFPASSPGQFYAVQRIAETLKKSAISAMARAKTEDIKKAGEAIRDAKIRYIHTSIATSPVHRKMKLRKSRSEILKIAVEAVQCAAEFADFVEIGAEDATRTEPEFLMEFCTQVTDAGADVVNIADTIGYIQPLEFFTLIGKLYNEIPAFKNGKTRLSVHCHNDLGLAVANTLSGLSAGAIQAEVTILGIGERGGNTPLEEIAAVLTARNDYYNKITASLDMKHFAEAVRYLTSVTGLSVQPNKPVAGKNAFSHSSGIHQNGMLASASTYSVLLPENFGLPPHRFILSRHSGMSGFNAYIRTITGDRIRTTEDIDLLDEFKIIADSRKSVTATEVLTLLFEEGIISSSIWYLKSCTYTRTDIDKNTHSVEIEIISIYGNRKKVRRTASSKWKSITAVLKSFFAIPVNIIHYSFTGSGMESDCCGTFFMTAEYEGNNYSDEMYGDDSIELFARSYLNIINQISAKYNLEGI